MCACVCESVWTQAYVFVNKLEVCIEKRPHFWAKYRFIIHKHMSTHKRTKKQT